MIIKVGYIGSFESLRYDEVELVPLWYGIDWSLEAVFHFIMKRGIVQIGDFAFFDHKEYGMYVYMYISMYVHRIIFKPIQIVWKLKVDEFWCKIRRFRPKIDDLRGDIEGGQFCPLPPREFSASVDPREE